MIDVKELTKMLDDALESESVESLSLWMEERKKADLEAGIIRNADFEVLKSWHEQNSLVELQEDVIQDGIYVNFPYHTVSLMTDEFETNSDNDYNFAA